MASIGIGLVGYRFMGKAHSNAYRQVHAFFPEVQRPRMVAISGRDEAGVSAAAHQFGWERYETDYRALITDPSIQVIDVSAPGHLHHTIVLEALAAGKHVLCEKPLANSLDEAADMVRAWRRAGTIAMVNFNYRKVPAIMLAQQLIQVGSSGEIRSFRARYLQDWLHDANAPMSWRLQREFAGSGALGDIGAHIVDLAHMLVGTIESVTGLTKTAVTSRPWVAPSDGRTHGEVTVDDWVAFLARFENGATGVFEASRLATGRKNQNTFEVDGSKGSIAFDLEDLNRLNIFLSDDDAPVQGFHNVLVTDPSHPLAGNWWPAGHVIGWEHTHIHQVRDLLIGVQNGVQPVPDFEDGYRCQAVLDAVERSSASGRWESPAPLPG